MSLSVANEHDQMYGQGQGMTDASMSGDATHQFRAEEGETEEEQQQRNQNQYNV